MGQPLPHPPPRLVRPLDAAQVDAGADERRSATLTLYDHPGSTNSYKALLLLALLGVEHERVTLPFGRAADRSEWFLRVNPRGLVPMLGVDGDFIWDSTAILVYLGRRFGNGSWLSADALEMARVMQWLALAQSELLHGLVRVRHIMRGSRSGNIEDAKRIARAGLNALEHQLARTDWLVGAAPTIADVACYPHTARAGESGFELREYPAIRAWIDRIEALPRWLPRETGAGRPWA